MFHTLIRRAEMEDLNARITRRKFLALREQGFTEQQTIELCKRPL